MPDLGMLQSFLVGTSVDADVFTLRPDCRAVLLAVDVRLAVIGDWRTRSDRL